MRKGSGIEGWRPDRREWRFESLVKAEKEFDRRLKKKETLGTKIAEGSMPRKFLRLTN